MPEVDAEFHSRCLSADCSGGSSTGKPGFLRLHYAIWLIALVIACTLPLIWPGDSSFLQDEATLLLRAEQWNHSPGSLCGIRIPFTLASRGLLGTHGVNYGPASEWFYQLLLAVSHDLPTLVLIRAAAVTAATALGLWWIGRYARLNRWFVVVMLLSPWVWWYSRGLWDNSFCIPLSALGLGAYLGFIATGRSAMLAIAFVCSLLLPLVHFMALPLSAAILLHLILTQYKQIYRHLWLLIVVLAIIAAAGWRYLAYIDPGKRVSMIGGGVPWQSTTFPLWGASYLSGINLSYVLGGDWLRRGGMWTFAMKGAIGISLLAYPLVWIGMVQAVREGWKLTARPVPPARVALAQLCVIVLALQMVLDGVSRVYPMQHYYNGTWVIFAGFAWLTVELLMRCMATRIAITAYGVACLAMILLMMLRIHRDGGVRDAFTAVADQQRMCDAIGRYPAGSPVNVRETFWEKSPSLLKALQAIRPTQPDPRLPRSKLFVRYAQPAPDAHLQLSATPVGK